MSRSQRLLDLLQILRLHRYPVTGAALATELGISLRTLYRDIATLQSQGAAIDGEPGLGYVLRPGFMLPPLMFSEDELEALVLGSRWVSDRGDKRLASAARDALAKIAAVLPADLRQSLDATQLLIGPGEVASFGEADLSLIRQAIRTERKLALIYRDQHDTETNRTIWPFALAYFDRVRVLVAWCETREAFRHFRTDRIVSITPTPTRYPRRRQQLLQEWRAQQGISDRRLGY